ncbi:MAG: ATP-dependent helicase/nuclease subunit A [Wolbachia endosymbiont of Ctenocephalides orientis wCori]|nr:MAG: ATP-dependent helicase/nuclease subunit A [Wolbachia endosymbiont of Ctenocephalides orientis wCori]
MFIQLLMKNKAISPNFSVWVNASAGTGKTKILIDRVLRLLLENKKNILCLTFTNAAANEMEDRIHNTLSKWAACSDSELMEDLKQLLDSKVLDHQARRLFSELEGLNLTIQTIHAFCYKLISNFPIETGIAPGCTLNECKELHPIVFDKTLHNEAIQDDINFIAAEIDENKLRDLLYTLCTKRPASDLEYIKNKLNAPNEIYDLQNGTIEDMKELAEILSEGSKRDQNYSIALCRWCNSVNKEDIENIVKIFIKSELHEKKSVSSIITKITLEKFPNAEELIKKIQDVIFTYIKDINAYKIFKRTSSLLNISKIYTDLYNSEKSKNAFLDYNDIIDLATNLLSDHNYKDWVLFNLDQKIDHILIDEAQDNSVSQWKVITSLCDEFFAGGEEKRTLFVVGDVKQSIYRFQGADPYLFNYMQEYFRVKTAGIDWISCQLEKSFRSTPEILALVDRIFCNFQEEISFNHNEIKHIPHRENCQGYVEIWPSLPRCKSEEHQALKVSPADRGSYTISDRLLAQTISKKIHNWLNDGRILVAKDRHIEPKDIMILVRQRNVLVDYIISKLKKANIPVIGRDYFRIMDYIAVQDLIALAEFLLLPANDLALANTLKSPLFNFTEEDLFNIAYNRKEQSLWERLKDYSQDIYNELNDILNLSTVKSPLMLFTHILRAGKKKFASRLGVECFEVIDEFMNLLLQFEHQNTPSLQAFVQWVKESNPEIKNDMQSERNAVRVMTIHKSKGLQAPVVFLVDTNTVPRNSESIIFDQSGVPFWCGKNNNAYCDQVKGEKKNEDYNEYLRLLYVALTRAEDELYILSKEPIQKGSWYDLITSYEAPYEKKQANLYPMFKEKTEILCINPNYPYIYKKRDYFDVPVVSLPQNLGKVLVEERAKHEEGFTRGKIIHSILQYLPKIEKARRENWIKKYLESINVAEDKCEIYDKVLAFDKKYGYLFDLEGKSEISLNGVINNEAVLVRLDRLCIMQDKVMIIDYKSHRNVSALSLNEIEKQMLTYKILVQEVYPNKKIECMVIWVEDLTTSLFSFL